MSLKTLADLRVPQALQKHIVGCIQARYCSSSVTASERKPVFKHPTYIPRGPTDILRALSNSVNVDTTGPHYTYQDDPYLSPTSKKQKRLYAKCKEAGRDNARFVRNTQAQLFDYRTSHPVIKDFLPSVDMTADSDASEQVLLELIHSFQVLDACEVYRACVEQDVALSESTKLALLELVAYHNEEEEEADGAGTDLYFDSPELPGGRSGKDTWRKSGIADSLASELQHLPAAQSALVVGLARHGSSEAAHERYTQALGAGLSRAAHNQMIGLVPELTKTPAKAWEYVEGVLSNMAAAGVLPDVSTLNNALEVLASSDGKHRDAKRLSLALVEEMRLQGVQPSPASFYFLLRLHGGHRNDPSDLLQQMITQLWAAHPDGCLPLQDARDRFFFAQAMNECKTVLHDLPLAAQLHALLHTQGNHKFLADDKNSIIYYRNFLLLSLETQPLSDFMVLYERLVPHTFVLDRETCVKVIRAVTADASYQYLPMLWTDINSMKLVSNEQVLDEFLMGLSSYHPSGGAGAVQGVLCGQVAGVVRGVLRLVREAWEDWQGGKRLVVQEWKAWHVSTLLEVCCNISGGVGLGGELVRLVAEDERVVLGELDAAVLARLCGLAVAEMDSATAIASCLYVNKTDPERAQEMAQLLVDGLDLNPKQTQVLSYSFPSIIERSLLIE